MRLALLATAALGLSLAVPGLAAESAAQTASRCAVAPSPMAPQPAALSEGATTGLDAAGEVRALLEAGQLGGLEAKLAQAHATAEAVEDPRVRALLLIHLGRTALRLSEGLPKSRARLKLRTAEILNQAGEAARKTNDGRLLSYSLGYLGELYESEGRLEDARGLTRRALFTAQTADAPDALYRWQWQLGRIHRASGKRDLALANYREAIETLTEIRDELALSSREDETAFRNEVEPVYLGLVDLLLARAARDEHAGDKQVLLAEARGTLEDWKAAELREYFHDACLDAQRKATPDTIPGAVVVYPIALPDRLELIVSDRGKLERYSSPVPRDELVAEVRAFREKLEKRTTRQYLTHARHLYDWLIRPFEPTLAGREKQLEALVFVPGGALRTVPLAALHDRESQQHLIEKYPLAITPGLTLTDPQAIDRAAVQVLAAGITEPVQGYPALDNVGHELETLGEVFPGEKLVNEQFVVKRFKGELAGQPFGIVHIASHGEFSGDVSESFLLAFDQKLSMDELAGLVATTQFREDQPLELLTLSACQTAVGDDRAALGLAGVALRAGARSALATLWFVNDQASSQLVSEFYTQLGNPRLSRAQALQRAQVKLMQMHHYRHPGYWSPYLLISSWL